MRITKTQKNKFLEIVEKHNLLPSIFETTNTDDAFKVKYKEDYFSFEVKKLAEDDYIVNILPIHNRKLLQERGTWDKALRFFDFWAMQLDEELNTPDKWKGIFFEDPEHVFDLSAYNKNLETDEFTEFDIESLQKSFPLLINEIKKLELIKEKQDEIINRLKEIPIPEKGLDKKKWMRWVFEKVAGMVIDKLLTPENAFAIMIWLKTNVFVKFLTSLFADKFLK